MSGLVSVVTDGIVIEKVKVEGIDELVKEMRNINRSISELHDLLRNRLQ